jgi:hypothetical protein
MEMGNYSPLARKWVTINPTKGGFSSGAPDGW